MPRRIGAWRSFIAALPAPISTRREVAADRVARLQQRWGVDPNVPIILHAARLTRWKGQTVLLDAVARLQPQRYLA